MFTGKEYKIFLEGIQRAEQESEICFPSDKSLLELLIGFLGSEAREGGVISVVKRSTVVAR